MFLECNLPACVKSHFEGLLTQQFLYYAAHLQKCALVHKTLCVGTSVIMMLVRIWHDPAAAKTSGCHRPFLPLTVPSPPTALGCPLMSEGESQAHGPRHRAWTLIYHMMGSHAGNEHPWEKRKAQRVIPTSVKKPAIPAWQEPCSSPYFFLYSRGGGEGREANHSLISVCQLCAECLSMLGMSLSAAAGPAQGRRPDWGAEKSLRNPPDLKNPGSGAIR